MYVTYIFHISTPNGKKCFNWCIELIFFSYKLFVIEVDISLEKKEVN